MTFISSCCCTGLMIFSSLVWLGKDYLQSILFFFLLNQIVFCWPDLIDRLIEFFSPRSVCVCGQVLNIFNLHLLVSHFFWWLTFFNNGPYGTYHHHLIMMIIDHYGQLLITGWFLFNVWNIFCLHSFIHWFSSRFNSI